MKFLCLAMSILTAMNVLAVDWPQFLGPNRNGSVSDEELVRAWLKNGIQVRWQKSIGSGYSGLVVQHNQVFTMESDGKDEFLVALEQPTGKQQWRMRTGSSPDDVYGGLGPRVTPSVDRDLVITGSAEGDLLAFRTANGQLIWKRSLVTDLGWRAPAEGTSCSPLIQDRRVYLIVGGSPGNAFAAFDRGSGKTLWTSQTDRISYSSPVRLDFGGLKQVLFLSGSNLFSVSADNGKLYWKYPWPTYDFVNVATPIVIAPDRIFISSGYDQGAAMLRVEKKSDGSLQVLEIWRNREMKNHFNNSVYHNSVIYGFDNAILKAIDAQTGKTLWRQSGFGTGSIIRAGNYLIILSASGELMLAKADPNGLRVEAKLKVLNGKSWTPPSIANGKIFVRNHTQAVCLTP